MDLKTYSEIILKRSQEELEKSNKEGKDEAIRLLNLLKVAIEETITKIIEGKI